jgi:hypothetical protein
LGLPFKELLPESAIKQAISELKIKYKKRLFDPFVTLWAFLTQVLDSDKTCHNAVSKIVVHLAPIAKTGVIFSLVTGASIALCIDVLNTHDIKLARKLYSFLNPNDVLLGDRAFCAYADMFAIKQLGCDAVFRKHQSRTTTMRKGKIVGDCDKLVTWYKPKRCPKGLSKDEFLALTPSITVREIYYYIVIP